MRTVIKIADEAEFFRRGRDIAALADQGRLEPQERVLSFADVEDLAKLTSVAKLELLREVRQQPGSITALAIRLHRDRSAVKRDISQMAAFGLLELFDIPLPGHGRQKEVRATADQVLLAL